MVVFANIVGKWIELDGEDCIEDQPAEIYVNYILSKENINSLNKFLKVAHNNLIYNVHISQIQWATDRY
jgi:hypothetical protein